MPRTVALLDRILVDDLQTVVVDVPLVNQRHVFRCAIVACQHLHVVFLNLTRLFNNMLVRIGDRFRIREGKAVQRFELCAQVGEQIRFLVDGQIGIALLTKLTDKLRFQLGFTLISVGTLLRGFVGRDDGVFRGFGDDVEVRHDEELLLFRSVP